MRFPPLVVCPGPHGRGCGDRALVETGRTCSECQHAEERRRKRATDPQPARVASPEQPRLDRCCGPRGFYDCPDRATVDRRQGKRCRRCAAEAKRAKPIRVPSGTHRYQRPGPRGGRSPR